MKKIPLLMLMLAIMLAACGGVKKAAEPDFYFNYKDAKWGMSPEEVVKAAGTPDVRTDVDKPEEDPSIPVTLDGVGGDYEYLDFYYYDKMLFDSFPVTEKYLFDQNDRLWGVTAYADTGKIAPDLTNLEEITRLNKETFMSLREALTEMYGQPAAEYTAYMEDGSYKTEETLDLDKQTASICASRWDGNLDGNNYRFIYVMYYAGDNSVQVKYMPHDKETVEAVNEQN